MPVDEALRIAQPCVCGRETPARRLERSHYLEGFPQLFRLAYVPESRQLVVQYGLPAFDRIPAIAEYKYVKTGDKVTERPRTAASSKMNQAGPGRTTANRIGGVPRADGDELRDVA